MIRPRTSPDRRQGIRVLCISMVVAALWVSATRADVTQPSPQDHYVTLIVGKLIGQGHLFQQPMNDETSRRCLGLYLKTLDPRKRFFYAADIQRFSKRENDLDDLIRAGNLEFAYEIFGTFLERVDERSQWVDDLVQQDHDFTRQEELVTDPDASQYAGTKEDARDLWRRWIKYDLLVQQAEGKDLDEAKEKVARRYHTLARRMHQIDSDELLEMHLTALTTSYDPHSTYMSPSTREDFEIIMKLELEGIGASLSIEDEYTEVREIIPGGAADKAGQLKVGDRIAGVGQGAAGEIADVVGMKLRDVVKMIRGKKGTVVRLAVIPTDQTEQEVYEITRARIELADQEARGVVVENGTKPGGSPYRIGVIDLPSFYMDMDGAQLGLPNFRSTTRDVRRILQDFRAKAVDGVVLDLRRNGGGSLTEAIDLTGLFIDQGPVVQVKGHNGGVQQHHDDHRGYDWTGPLVVLTSKRSASASEILAGAIQDYHRGLLVGDGATHGKGTVQRLLDVGQQLWPGLANPRNLGALKITMQQFYRPSGASTQNRGVVADVVLPSVTSHVFTGEKDFDYAIPFDQVAPARFQQLGKTNPAMIEELSRRSFSRRASSEEFRDVAEKIERLIDRKNRKSISLNHDAFMEEWTALNSEEKEEEKAARPPGERPVFDLDDFYNREALAVTIDYLEVLRDGIVRHAVNSSR